MSQRQISSKGASRPRAAVNLFRGQLTRRPPASSTNSSETLRLDVEVLSDTSEIVVRNQQGEIELGDPPALLSDGSDEQADERLEIEKERQRLAEAVKHHRVSNTSVPDQSEELLEAVKASLHAKVSALAEDNWMFEPEDQLR